MDIMNKLGTTEPICLDVAKNPAHVFYGGYTNFRPKFICDILENRPVFNGRFALVIHSCSAKYLFWFELHFSL